MSHKLHALSLLQFGMVKTSEFMNTNSTCVVMNSDVFILSHILNGTYMFWYLYLNNVKHYMQFPAVGFLLFIKKPSASVQKPTTDAVHPQSVPIGLVTIFTTNSLASPDKITALVRPTCTNTTTQNVFTCPLYKRKLLQWWCSHLSNAGW